MSDKAGDSLGNVDPLTNAELLRRAADFKGQREGADAGMAVIDEALAAYEALPPSVGFVYALLRKAALFLADGRFSKAFDFTRAAAQVAEQVGDGRAHRTALSWLAWHEGVKGHQEQAVRTMSRAAALVPVDSDPEGDIRQAVLLTDLLLQTGGSVDEVDLAGQPGLDVAERWEIESYHVLLARSNMVRARIRCGRVADAAAMIDPLSEEPVNIDRWPLHLDRAVLDCLRGQGDLARQRIASLLEGFDDRVIGDDVEFLHDVASVHLWNGEANEAFELLIPALNAQVESPPAGVTEPALLLAARAAADAASLDDSVARRRLDTLLRLHSRLPEVPALERDAQRPQPAGRAFAANWRAEIARLDGTETVDHWVTAGRAWDVLSRPHDAAYCRSRAAEVATREGRRTVAVKLLQRAAVDAREHAPLLDAIRRTMRGSP